MILAADLVMNNPEEPPGLRPRIGLFSRMPAVRSSRAIMRQPSANLKNDKGREGDRKREREMEMGQKRIEMVDKSQCGGTKSFAWKERNNKSLNIFKYGGGQGI